MPKKADKKTPVKKKPVVKNKGGRPSKKTPKRIADAVKYLKFGLSERTACDLIGINFSTWIRWKTSDTRFATNIKKARAGAVHKATTKLSEKMDAGDLTAIIFFLKTRSEEFKQNANGNLSKPTTTESPINSKDLIEAIHSITKLSRNSRKVS